MKVFLFFILLIFTISPACEVDFVPETNSELSFIKFFGNYGNDKGFDIQQTKDNGYVIVGSLSNAENQEDVYVVKTDSYGNLIWWKTFGNQYFDQAKQIRILPDGSFIIFGTTTSMINNNLQHNFYLLKLNSFGDKLWEKSIGSQNSEIGVHFDITNDLGYILVGNTDAEDLTHGNPFGKSDIFIVKTNSLGDSIWSRSYGGSKDEFAATIIAKENGEYIILGSTESFSASEQANCNILIFETNAHGVEINAVTYGSYGNETAYSMKEIQNEGYIIIGTETRLSNRAIDIALWKIERNIQTLVWKCAYGDVFNDIGYDVLFIENEGYMIVGSTESFGALSTDILVLKTDLSGVSNAPLLYGHEGNEIACKIIPTSSNGYAIIGTTDLKDNSMICFLKTDDNGNITNFE